jgi:hypothetical protein
MGVIILCNVLHMRTTARGVGVLITMVEKYLAVAFKEERNQTVKKVHWFSLHGGTLNL